MARIVYDNSQEAVSSRIRELFRQGVGRASADGTPSFSSQDVIRHQEIINRQSSPVLINEATNERISGYGLDFKTQDDTELNTIRDLTIAIGDLKAKQFENQADLISNMQKNPAVAGAQSLVSTLAMELASTANENTRKIIQGELGQAQKALETAQQFGLNEADMELKKRNSLINADIARLEARRQNLLDLEAKGQAGRLGYTTPTLDNVLKAQIPGIETYEQASLYLKNRPEEAEMWKATVTDTPPQYWNPIFEQNRSAYRNSIINRVPESERDAVREEINLMDKRMALARQQAAERTAEEIKRGGPAAVAALKEPKARQAMEDAIFEQIMQEGTNIAWQSKILSTPPEAIKREWFSHPEAYDIAVEMQRAIDPNAPNIETAYPAVIKASGVKGIDVNVALQVASEMIAGITREHIRTNRWLGNTPNLDRGYLTLQTLFTNTINQELMRQRNEQLQEEFRGLGPLVP